MRYSEIIEAANRATKPAAGVKVPLTPEQSRRKSERQATLQKQRRAEDLRHSAKLADLNAKLTRP